MIRKLYDLGIRGGLLKWIRAFLVGRFQRVVVNGVRSEPISVKSGIPQGSVLGPILFISYVNDLPSCVKSDIKLFADDTKLYASGREMGVQDQHQIQVDLVALESWSATWLLPFNQNKCKILHLGHGNPQCEYTLLGSPVTQVTEEKDLGVVVDEQLKFRMQAATAISKANQILGIIRRSFELLDVQVLPLLFKTWFAPT